MTEISQWTETQIAPVDPQTPPESTHTRLDTIRQDILNSALTKYWVDLKSYQEDLTSLDTTLLEANYRQPQYERLLEQQAKELFERSLKGKEAENANLDFLTASLNSEQIKEIQTQFEALIGPKLDTYTFLDDQTKEFLKLGIATSLMKSPLGQIGDSLIGGIGWFIAKTATASQKWLEELISSVEQWPSQDSGRVLAWEEIFTQQLGTYLSKLDELQAKFKEENISVPQIQQNIVSHIEWFRDPAKISQGTNWLDISKIDFTQITKNNTPLNTDTLREYLMSSRENLVSLAKKMQAGDQMAQQLYGILQWDGKVSGAMKSIAETLLKIPILGKFFAILLWLNPENAINELGENVKSFQVFSALKWLGKHKDSEGKDVDWKDRFKDSDLSYLSFNSLKKEIKQIQSIVWETQKEKLPEIWQNMFSEKGLEKEDLYLKFTLPTNFPAKPSNTVMKQILQTWIDDYNNKKSQQEAAKKTQEQQAKQTSLNTEIWKLSSNIEDINKKIDHIDQIQNKAYEKIDHWDDRLNNGDINDVTTQDIISHRDKDTFWDLIGKTIWEDDYKNLPEEDKALLNTLFWLIRDFSTTNNISSQDSLGTFLKGNQTQFETFLQERKKELEQQKTEHTNTQQTKQNELGWITGETEKQQKTTKLMKAFQDRDSGSLTWNGIELNWETISFDTNKQELSLLWERYSISIEKATFLGKHTPTITEITLTKDTVIFRGNVWGISWDANVSKQDIIRDLQNLIATWSQTTTRGDITTTMKKVTA